MKVLHANNYYCESIVITFTMYLLLSNHAWVSFQGFSESYNEGVGVEHEFGNFFDKVYRNVFICMCYTEMKPKLAAKAFWVGECENELRRLKRLDFRFHEDDDINNAFAMIDEERKRTIYEHTVCSELCKSRGNLLVFDVIILLLL